MTCICGRGMTAMMGYDERGWRYWWTCLDHPGLHKLSSDCLPLPAVFSPPPIALHAER